METKLPMVFISDKLSESAVDVFKKMNIETDYKPGINKTELLNIIHKYDGLAIRSATNVTEESTGISASYTVGSASIRAHTSKTDNYLGSTGDTKEYTELSLLLSF